MVDVSAILFVAGLLAEFMSGKPDAVPKFVDDMMKASGIVKPAAETSDCQSKSEVADAARPSVDPRPRTDIPRASDTIQPSQMHQKSDQLADKKEMAKSADVWFVSY